MPCQLLGGRKLKGLMGVKKPAPANLPVILKFDRRNTTEADLVFVRSALAASPGERPVEFLFIGEDGRRLLMLPRGDAGVTLSDEVKAQLRPWLQH